MRLLLDTHVIIWWNEGIGLTPGALDAIQRADQVYVSAITGWEITIKASLGRLETKRRMVDVVRDSGFEELPVRLAHAAALNELPSHHRDPFDRMLVAQARHEGLTLVIRDEALKVYDVKVLPA